MLCLGIIGGLLGCEKCRSKVDCYVCIGVGPFKHMAGFLEGFMSVFLLRECAAECACVLLVAAKAWLAGRPGFIMAVVSWSAGSIMTVCKGM